MHLLQSPMNPYNLQHSFYLVGDTIALAIYLLIIKSLNIKKCNIFIKLQSNNTSLNITFWYVIFHLYIYLLNYCLNIWYYTGLQPSSSNSRAKSNLDFFWYMSVIFIGSDSFKSTTRSYIYEYIKPCETETCLQKLKKKCNIFMLFNYIVKLVTFDDCSFSRSRTNYQVFDIKRCSSKCGQ